MASELKSRYMLFPEGTLPKSTIYVYDADHWAFHNLSLALIQALIDVGFNAKKLDFPEDKGDLIIVFGHMILGFAKLPKRYILYQTEQVGAPFFNGPYQSAIRNATMIWDYSLHNMQSIQKKFSFDQSKYFLVPFWYHSSLTRGEMSFDYPTKTYDVMFLGWIIPGGRREKLLKSILATGLNVLVVQVASKDTVETKLRQSKIILNIHQFDGGSILELSRISWMLAMGAVVLSEPSEDTQVDRNMLPCMKFAPVADLPAECIRLTQPENDTALREFGRYAHNYFKTHMSLTTYITSHI